MAQGEWQDTTRLIDAAIGILHDENPMTIRQLFYRLVSISEIKNCLRDYQRVSRAMTMARKDGRVPYEWIVDRSRTMYSSGGWDDLQQLSGVLEETLKSYRRDYWQDQPHYVEIWCEKDAVIGSIEEIQDEYGLTVEPVRGFDSTTKVHEAAERLLKKEKKGKTLTIFYLGDWDPSGKDIQRDLEDRLEEHGVTVRLDRVAIFKEDIKKFNLPPLPVKDKDPRA